LAREAGAVYVHLIDASSKRPAAGILVRLGDQARLTDAEGWVQFSELDAGRYFLEVDRSKIAAELTISPASPVGIDVHQGQTQRMELSLVQSVRITGRARVFEYQEGRAFGAPDSIVDAGPLTDIVVTLADGDTVRAVPDATGRFRFADLHPGRWVLTVSSTTSGPQQRLERERFEFDLKPGDARDVEIRALPVRRAVRIVARAELTPGRAPVTAVAPPPPPAIPARAVRGAHVVAAGEFSLMQIARNEYGDAALWAKIWVANRVKLRRPEALRLGDTLVVPPRSALTSEEIAARDQYVAERRAGSGWPQLDSTWRAPAVRHYYTVTDHDVSLMQIARVMYDDKDLWPKIWLANLDQLQSPETLRVGQRLRVPEETPLTPAEIAARDAYLSRRRQQ
jgi:hypothetical protein